MNGNWTRKWKNCLIWFSAYMSFIAYALVGGYFILKNDDEEYKKTTKKALIVTMIFAAVSGFFSIFTNFAGMSDAYYSSAAYDFYDIATRLVNVAKIAVYAVFIVIELAKKEAVAAPEEAKDTDAE